MSTTALAFDSTTFRRTLGMFATGITVVTARAADGSLVGLTVNSFNSVSLDPPLIVWSLTASSSLRSVFESCDYYAVNVLAADQQPLSNRFAGRSADRFAGVEWEEGLGGAPLLVGSCAIFEVRNRERFPGGDHLVFIGEVARCERSEREPLLYFNGAYRSLSSQD